MITVNCAAIPENLIETELFGHEKGSFTGAVNTRRGLVEAAEGGTLFLDEVGELPLAAQARLLRVLQDGEIRRVGASKPWRVDLRLIAATHRDLKQLVDRDEFRDDLYFRLRVVEISLPPLRERDGDIVRLANYLLDKTCKRLHRSSMTFAPEAVAVMEAYSWPGNVRELENAIERAVILCDDQSITSDMLAIDTYGHDDTHLRTRTGDTNASLDDYIRKFVLENQRTLTETELARRLGISRKTLWEKRQRLGIPRKRRKKVPSENFIVQGP